MPIDLTVAQAAPVTPSVLLALWQGVLSFLSPCVLPLLPVYFAYLVGAGGAKKGAVLRRMAGFALGFMAFYVVLGAGAGALGSVLNNVPRRTIDLVCGALFILFGILLLEVIPGLHLPGLNVDPAKYASGGFFSMLLFGIVLALSWAPCTTAFLSSILALAASADGATMLSGMGLLTVYALGMMLPFLLCMALFGRLGAALGFLKRHQLFIRRAGACVMILLGVLKLAHLY